MRYSDSDIRNAMHGVLSRREPTVRAGRNASVAVIFARHSADTSLLFIERARVSGDPWSGDIAFPGGMRDQPDSSYAATAARETMEEVGIHLDLDADFLGYWRRFKTLGGLSVIPSVFSIGMQVAPRLNRSEAVSYKWIPLGSLVSPDNIVMYSVQRADHSMTTHAISVSGYTIWGLTYRILISLFEAVGFRI